MDASIPFKLDEMKQTIYIPVKAEPTIPGYYDCTTIQDMKGVFYWDGKKWWHDPDQDGHLAFGIKDEFIDTWLKPVEMPSEEEIIKIIESRSTIGSADTTGKVYYSYLPARYFKEIAQAIAKLMKG